MLKFANKSKIVYEPESKNNITKNHYTTSILRKIHKIRTTRNNVMRHSYRRHTRMLKNIDCNILKLNNKVSKLNNNDNDSLIGSIVCYVGSFFVLVTFVAIIFNRERHSES